MNKDKILNILSDIIESDINDFPTGALLESLGFTSIKFIQFIVTIEEEFDIEVYDSDLLISNFETIEMIFNTLEKYFNSTTLKKVLVCDCDNVLWHGIYSEEDTYINQENLMFQNELIELYNSGVLICLCSRNEQIRFDELNMPLKNIHITISKININDKATNIKMISDELNLSLDSFVFVDDSDYEIGLINSLIPEVETIKVDYGNLSFIQETKSLFNLQSSDFNRTQLYKEQKEREKEKLHLKSVEEYNNSLKTEIICTAATTVQAERISELSQRTNQFNLSGKRYSTDDINNFINDNNYTVVYLSMIDKYGDMGIVGVSIVKQIKDVSLIDSFYISCRVFGRGCEYVLIEVIKNLCSNKQIFGTYNQTDKNQRYADFYISNGVEYYVE